MADKSKIKNIYIFFAVLFLFVISIIYWHGFNYYKTLNSKDVKYLEHTKIIFAPLNRNLIDEEMRNSVPNTNIFEGDFVLFIVNPPSGSNKFLVFISEKGDSGEPFGFVRRFSYDGGRVSFVDKKFNIPPVQFQHFIDSLWQNNVKFEGSEKKCLDGPKFLYEQRRNDRVISGGNWRGCSDHYADISKYILDQVKEWISFTGLPENDDWTYRNYSA